MKEMFSVGFMVFSIFFGAGNLIFPPLLAQNAGTNYPMAVIGFLTTGIGLPLLGLIAIVKFSGKYTELVEQRVHPWFRIITFGLLYLAIGPLFAVPRTGAVSFEIGIRPFLPVDFMAEGQYIYTAIFFILTYFFAANPSRLVDTVGKVLSPVLLLFLCVLFVRTFYAPIGEILPPVDQYIDAPFASGFTDGYLTMDLLAALAVGGLAISAVKAKGVTEQKAIYRTCIKACLVAIVLMGTVYTALAYLGATCPSVLGYSANGGIILSSATYVFFGDAGKLVLAFIIGFACLTTSIGVSAAFASYYHYVSDGRLGYKKLLLVATLFSYWAANMGLTELIRISVPFLVALYPIFIVLVILSLCDDAFQGSSLVYRLSIGMTLPFSIMDGLQAAELPLPGVHDFLVAYLPLYSVNLGWLLPALAGAIVGMLWNQMQKSHQSA